MLEIILISLYNWSLHLTALETAIVVFFAPIAIATTTLTIAGIWSSMETWLLTGEQA